MLIQGAFMNVDDSLTAGQFLRFLSDEAPSAHYYVAQPPPGIIMTAAIDWRVVVPDTEAAGLASVLWSGYQELVKPRGRDEQGRAGVFIQIKNLYGDCDQFTLGRDIDQEDGFVKRVQETVAVLSTTNETAVQQELNKTNSSDYWVRLS